MSSYANGSHHENDTSRKTESSKSHDDHHRSSSSSRRPVDQKHKTDKRHVKRKRDEHYRRHDDRKKKQKITFKHQRVESPFKTKSAFVCPMRFQAALPDVPFDPKLYTYPFDPMRFVEYKTTSLEKNYKFQILTEPDMGIYIDIIDPNRYKIPEKVKLAPEDAALLEDDSRPTREAFYYKRQRPGIRESWLRRTEYIGAHEERKIPVSRRPIEATSVRAALLPMQSPTEESFESQLQAIEETFKLAKEADNLSTLKHPTKPHLKAVESIAIFPDFNLWENVYTQVVFDSDPIPPSKLPGKDGKPFSALSTEEQEQIRKEYGHSLYREAIITEGNSEKSVAYLLPKKKQDQQSEENHEKNVQEYSHVREYITDINSSVDAHFFVIDKEAKIAYFNNIGAKITMTKKKAKITGDLTFTQKEKPPPSLITVETREFTPAEIEERQKRRQELLPVKP